ncbi:isopenicillin N synthase family dioxygenase [Mycolicibacterium monacense]|uniref:Oxidoreductase n=4 Tax=Mycobacteriaceae TaxID=1762 RepID=A0AAD1IXK3_MYCMB|nr:2-oxoglutarate and iron-dependent oxygenase domain-containing protein [Mycolicibacterium monacense]MDA4105582.1 2OG-Fe(II) oxygenase [Mycolicibacterium monacense DSM 44395]ORB13481.1 2OG-Fe(II) oxygenase [Mycolicibacterium monacense DSM 44395]QHP85567.1 isopenicillin N synthase family oxygenase [Mycolicibacterium monacense DSM 44395]BBZ61535.1 oxidoreductase [Mycolicibacterium monacense]
MNGATSFTSVPTVDISGLQSDDRAEHERVAADLGAAARDVGFFYISGSGIDESLFDRMLAATKEFFALPLEEKMRTYIGLSRCHRGYVPVGEEGVEQDTPDFKEAFDTALDLPGDDPDYLAGNPMLGPNAWPDLPGFAESVTAYYTAVLEVGQRLLWAFAIALGEDPDVFTRHATKTPSQLRLVHYPHNPDAEDRMGIGAHTDYECFTLLKPTAPGLEVLNGAGEWIDVPPVPGTFVVNIGDMLELWTNGAFVATSHRVRKVKEERYSFPLFFNVDYHTEVKPLPQFAPRDDRPRPALRAGEHLFAQTAQSFAYLRRRLDSGELVLPEGSLAPGQFGQQALQGTTS